MFENVTSSVVRLPGFIFVMINFMCELEGCFDEITI